jgi:cold shock protein
MTEVKVELVKYDMDKTKKRKRTNFSVEIKSEEAVIEKLEKIHKGEKVLTIHEIIWGEEISDKKGDVEILTGMVKFFDEAKGFGFIQADEDMEELFFHVSSLGGKILDDQDLVEFQLTEGPKGPVAIKIKLID